MVSADYTDRLSYYDDWKAAFLDSPQFEVEVCDIARGDAARRLRLALKGADAAILLHSTNGDTTRYLEPVASVLAERKCRLLTFVGNEVNLPGSPISAKRAVFATIRPDYIATQLLRESGEYLFGDLAERGVVALPHALNPEAFHPQVPHRERGRDIGVRAVKYLAHLGDDDRNRVHEFFARHEFAPDLKVDISTERFNRDGWAAFLNDCRGTVSTEAGSWFIERDDATMQAIRAWTAQRNAGRGIMIANDSPLRLFGHKLPFGWRRWLRKLLSRGPIRHESAVTEALAFDEIHERFFAGRPIPEHHGKCISSRHFDAIGTATCQILLEGRYNDILSPDVHYIRLASDFSNISEVMEAFRDERRRLEVTEAARAHVMDGHTYAHRAQAVYDILAGDMAA
ncbi:glycosyltransferase family protein [Pelagibius marinus]|uniref:glycosyltransferase family protein n=1 Tax=Pelagibius marinus TaxID=2762760 RepID=UPI001872D660|nr:glycosyltransferase [Pelagibius marinus]